MKTHIRLTALISMLGLNTNAAEVWITPTGTTRTNATGAITDPYITPTATAFDTVMNSPLIPANSTIHLTAGTFLTLQGVTLKSGWKVIGAGMDVTVVRLDVLSAAVLDPVIGGNGAGSGNYWYYSIPNHPFAKDDVSVSDFTVDINLQNQTVPLSVGAVGLAGHNSRITRIKVVNWGNTKTNSEEFLITIGTHIANEEIKRNAVIDSCIIGAPASVNMVDGITAISIAGSPNSGGTPGAGWIEGGEIRNCFIKDIECAPGGGLSKPTYFNGLGASGIGMKVRNNFAINLGPGATAVYMECGSFINYTIENNNFLDVASGIYLQGWLGNPGCSGDTSLIRRNLYFRNNLITLKAGGAGIVMGGFPGGVSGANKPSGLFINNNSVIAADGASSATGVQLSNLDTVSVEDNVIDTGAGSGVSLVGGVAVAHMSNNRKIDGSPSSTAGAAIPLERIDRQFTPSHAGWYRIILQGNQSSGTVHVHGVFDNKITDLEFTYDIPWSAIFGNITVLRNMRYSGGHISKIRISNDTWNGTSQPNYVDVYIPSVATAAPLNVEWCPGAKNLAQSVGAIFYLGTTAPVAESERIMVLGSGFRTSGPIYAGSTSTQITDDTGKILSSALNVIQPAQGGLGTATVPSTGALLLGDGSFWAPLTLGAVGKALVSTGTTASWGDALQEAGEMSSTPVTDTASTAVGSTTLRLFDFVTLPTTERFYIITGIEWKNGATAAGNTICGAVIVDQIPPTIAAIPTIAFGQMTANSGANSVQRVSNIVSQPIRGGTIIGVFVHANTTSQTYRTATVASQNNRKTSVALPGGGDVANQESAVWVASPTKAYLKVYYRGYK